MKTLIALAAAALLAVGCSSQSGDAGVAINTAFNPDPPKQGSENLTIAVKGADGAPVKRAIVKITTQMPSMSMTGPSTEATDNGDGTYSATLLLQYATNWHFIITASVNGKTGHSEVVKDVK